MTDISKDRKKKKNSNAPQTAESGQNQSTPEEGTSAQKRLAIMGFGGLGCIMAFLWGANAAIDVGISASPLVQAAKVSAAAATMAADWTKGLAFAFPGTVMGGTFGYAIFLAPNLMLGSLLAGFAGLLIGLFLHSPLLCGLGWLAGFGAVVAKAAAPHFGQAYQEVAAMRTLAEAAAAEKEKS